MPKNKAITTTEPTAADTIKTRWCFVLELADEALGLSAGTGTEDGVTEAAGGGANRGTIDGDGAGDGESGDGDGDGDGDGAFCSEPGLGPYGGKRGRNGLKVCTAINFL